MNREQKKQLKKEYLEKVHSDTTGGLGPGSGGSEFDLDNFTDEEYLEMQEALEPDEIDFDD